MRVGEKKKGLKRVYSGVTAIYEGVVMFLLNNVALNYTVFLLSCQTHEHCQELSFDIKVMSHIVYSCCEVQGLTSLQGKV